MLSEPKILNQPIPKTVVKNFNYDPDSYDSLTGLRDYAYVNHLITEQLYLSEYKNAAMLIFDIKSFGRVNEAFGHSFGNTVLAHVSHKLESLLKNAELTRICSDEFAVTYVNKDIRELEKIAVAILAEFSTPLPIEKRFLYINLTIGISHTCDKNEFKNLLKSSQAALRLAKKAPVASYYIMTDNVRPSIFDRVTLEYELHNAIQNHELELYYQPKLDMNLKRITGCEALLRWNHPNRGVIAAGDFIAIAEETDLILKIGEFVTDEVFKQLSEWLTKGLDVFISFNVSVKEFYVSNFEQRLTHLVSKYNIPTSKVTIEITEGVLIHDAPKVAGIFSRLRSQGFHVSLDDYGSGYASLCYLETLPLDNLKIDKQFVLKSFTCRKSNAILNHIIYLAHNIELLTVAEGVENKEQLDLLKDLGCDFIQGYYLSKPLPKKDFETLYNCYNSSIFLHI